MVNLEQNCGQKKRDIESTGKMSVSDVEGKEDEKSEVILITHLTGYLENFMSGHYEV